MSDEEKQFLKNFEHELEYSPLIRDDPSALARLIVSAIKELDQSKMILGSSKQIITNIEQRSWLKNIFSNGVHDIAVSNSQLVQAIELQNHSLELFLTLIKSVISLNICNMQFLVRLSDELSSGLNKVPLKDATTFNMTMSLISEAIKGAEYQDGEISYLKLLLRKEVEDLKNLYHLHEDAINNMALNIKKIKTSPKQESFRWSFYTMLALNFIIIVMIFAVAIKNIFS